MKPLGRIQWAGILLAGASAALSMALIDSQSQTVPLKWLLLASVVALLGSGVWVQSTWKTQ